MEQTLKDKRPKFHIYPERGWINDPNGLVYFKGEYHVFFQHYPDATHWGPMHWGHVASADLKEWRRLPIALYPGGEGDKDGCFSGTAIVWKDKLWLIYTGFIENGGGENVRQIQCLASSDDGVNFIKHGVIIGSNELPEEYNPCDFRDPSVFYEDGIFTMFVAARHKQGRGRVLVYKSKDLFKWTFSGDLFNKDCEGGMIECPDYVPSLNLLLTSEQFAVRKENYHLNIHTTKYFIGEYDRSKSVFNVQSEDVLDYGFDFYAGQTFTGEDVLIGWMSMWDRNIPSEKYGFAGMLTVPRRLKVVDGQLHQTPIVFGKSLLKTKIDKSFKDNAVVGTIKLKIKDLESFSMRLRGKGDECVKLCLEKGEWVFDRSKLSEKITGVEKDEFSLSGKRCMPFTGNKETEITVVMDLFSLEIFIDGKAMTSTIYPDDDADEIAIEVKSSNCEYERFSVENKI
ncbi:MAG: glycoside hydrolase family 32 protein [Clostridiales bacterium]|nr:glycoside hydrolase family 32 protein [Clostridiales bacterium]